MRTGWRCEVEALGLGFEHMPNSRSLSFLPMYYIKAPLAERTKICESARGNLSSHFPHMVVALSHDVKPRACTCKQDVYRVYVIFVYGADFVEHGVLGGQITRKRNISLCVHGVCVCDCLVRGSIRSLNISISILLSMYFSLYFWHCISIQKLN